MYALDRTGSGAVGGSIGSFIMLTDAVSALLRCVSGAESRSRLAISCDYEYRHQTSTWSIGREQRARVSGQCQLEGCPKLFALQPSNSLAVLRPGEGRKHR